MKPYTRIVNRVRHTHDYNPFGDPAYRHGEQLVMGELVRLSCPSSNPGNRVSPTAWGFTKEIYDFGDASLFNRDRDGSFRQIIGPGASTGEVYVSPPDSSLSSIYNDALGKLGEQIRGSLDLSVDAFQSRQALKMIKEVKSLVKFWRSFRPSELGNRWLEYQYGWKPMVSTIYGLAKEAVTPPKEGLMRLKVRSSGSSTREKRVLHDTPGIFTTPFGSSVAVSTLKERVELGVTIDLKPSVLNQLAQISSLNPASIGWELLPYSFVVDWVVDIGGYLRAAETACLYAAQTRSAYFSWGSQLTEARSWGYGFWGAGNYSESTGHDNTIVNKFSRTPVAGFPFPMRPQVRASLGSSRLTSAAALMSQQLSPAARQQIDNRLRFR